MKANVLNWHQMTNTGLVRIYASPNIYNNINDIVVDDINKPLKDFLNANNPIIISDSNIKETDELKDGLYLILYNDKDDIYILQYISEDENLIISNIDSNTDPHICICDNYAYRAGEFTDYKENILYDIYYCYNCGKSFKKSHN